MTNGTRYILQLDIYIPDADIVKVYSLLSDSFNYPHDLTILAQQNIEYEDE